MPRKCIDAEANAMLSDGSLKQIKDLEIGDKVKTLENGKLVDTDVIMIMDISSQECKLFHLNRHFSVILLGFN